MAKVNFEVKYKKGADNHHTDALSRLLTAAPTVDHEDDDDITTFLIDTHTLADDAIEIANNGLQAKAFNAEEEFTDVEYGTSDEILATLDVPSTDKHLNQITTEQFGAAEHYDVFWADIGHNLDEGVWLAFSIDDQGVLIRTGEAGPLIVVSHSLRKRVGNLNHFTVLAGHPGGHKLYY